MIELYSVLDSNACDSHENRALFGDFSMNFLAHCSFVTSTSEDAYFSYIFSMQLIFCSFADDVSISEAHSSPMLTPRSAKSATPSPVAHKSARSLGSQEWQHNEEDIDHLVAIHSKRNSLSNLGVSLTPISATWC